MGGAHPAFSLLPGNGFFDISSTKECRILLWALLRIRKDAGR
jgi:hypothetical protein